MSDPRLSVHLMVRDGASVVGRALRPLRGIADEVVYVDTGSTDGTILEIDRVCAEIGVGCRGFSISPASLPDLYFDDELGAYAPHTISDCSGLPLLRDWAAARNIGLAACRGRYVMKLDADDEVLTPQNIRLALDHLDQLPNIDILTCPYEVMDGRGSPEYIAMYTRLWRNKPEICFREVCHENVDWCRKPDRPNWIITNEALLFRDWRDNVGPSRVPHRNLKVLLREYLWYRRAGSLPSPHVLIHLADEAAGVLPELALSVLDELPVGLSLVDAAWGLFIRGRCYEEMKLFTDAGWYYRRAAEKGWERARMRNILMIVRRDGVGSGGITYLQEAIVANEGHLYPRHASVAEVEEARKLMLETRRRP